MPSAVPPPVLLLHSLGVSGRMWDGVAAALAPGRRTLAPDLRGHAGASADGPFTTAGAVDDLEGLCEREGVTGVHLVGTGLGSLVAVELAGRRPDLVRSLALASTYVRVSGGGAERLRATREQLASGAFEQFAASYLDAVLLPHADPTARRALLDGLLATGPARFLEALAAGMAADQEARLGSVRAPALVLVGAEDDRTPVAGAREVADLLPRARLQMLEGAGHLAAVDDPATFAAALEAFWSACESGETAAWPARTASA